MTPLPVSPLRRRAFLAALGGLATAPLLSSCGGEESEPVGGNGESTIRMCVYAQNHASSPLFWQQFAPEGVTVDVAVITSAAEVQQGLEADNLDFGLMGAYNTVIAAAEGRMTSKIVGMVARQGAAFIGSTEQGITSVADLAGKRIGTPSPGFQLLVLTTRLAAAGLQLGRDVEAVPLEYADQPAALARGDVDAYAGTEPLCAQSVAAGAGVRLDEIYDSPAGDLNSALWASSAALQNPSMVRTATRMQQQAAEYLSPGGDNDSEVWRDLLVSQFGYEEAVYEEVLDNIGAEWRFEDRREEQYRGAGAMLLEQGTIEAEPDYDELFAREYWQVTAGASTSS